MNDYLPKDELDPKHKDAPSTNRKALWIIGAGLGIYLIVSGVWGIITGG
ncbi:hypothetical protein SAMN04489806_1949 [Paramicrobacterium humi]|uniref:Uncharacterized protein n=1 Tax=Paramicrobacterium humi TaxID=640635 RepID=A0A1H4MRI0_9MICO|nr:hypothetical protein [Microbacterium humi]SEB85258.1 hypothetical protein SAMN04489806_1949 [Microbacterium humi]